MKTNVAFTICATNYIGLAKVLEKSICKYYNDLDFYIVVADEPEERIKDSLDDNVIIGKNVLNYSEQKWSEMAYKYDLTEFCTSIKPSAISYLFNLGYEKCIYFDPDILVFSSIKLIYEKLDAFDAIVTPHITELEEYYTGNLKEKNLLYTGTFNLGFFAIRNTKKSMSFISWWSKRLEDYCFSCLAESLFTDQKWVDLLPSYFGEKLLVSRNKGLNVAPWNFHERFISCGNDGVYVGNRLNNDEEKQRLIFVHYSGYDYNSLVSGIVKQKNIKNIVRYDDVDMLFSLYKESLLEGDFPKYIDQKYSYNFYPGTNEFISSFERILFRGYIEGASYNENPFDVNSSFYKKLRKRGFLKGNSITKLTYDDFTNKNSYIIKVINAIFLILFKIMGVSKYYAMTRAFYKYSIWENHYFLVSRKGDEYKMRR